MHILVVCFSILALVVNIRGYNLNRKFLEQNADVFEEIRNQSVSRLKEGDVFVATVNEFGDKILNNFDGVVKKLGFDPFPVPDINEGHWWGRIKLTNIHIDGMSTIKRVGDCLITYYHDTDKLQIDIPIGFEDLKFGADYRATVMSIGPRGKLTGGVTDLTMDTSILIDYSQNQAEVYKYKITHSGHISIKLHGNPLTDWITNIMINTTTALFKPVILGLVDVVVKGGMDAIVDVINEILKFFLGN